MTVYGRSRVFLKKALDKVHFNVIKYMYGTWGTKRPNRLLALLLGTGRTEAPDV
jgi:hypothetical protein